MPTDYKFAKRPEIYTVNMIEIFSIYNKVLHTKFVGVL
jgi:hypothetical protein